MVAAMVIILAIQMYKHNFMLTTGKAALEDYLGRFNKETSEIYQEEKESLRVEPGSSRILSRKQETLLQ